MKRIFAPFALALLVVPSVAGAAPQRAAPAAQSVDAAKLAEAHAIIEIIFPPAKREQMMDQILTELSAQIRPPMPASLNRYPGLKSILDGFLDEVVARERPLARQHLPEIMGAYAVAYTHEFSLSELKDIHAFAETRSGRHYLSRAAALLGDPAVARVNKRLVAEAQAIPQSMLPELTQKLAAYMKAHPEVAAQIKADSKAN